MVPALTSYSAGQMFYFVAAGDNTGAVTINIDSLGAKSVTRDGSTALVAGDIVSGEVALIVYDGTRFQLLNGNSFTNLNVSNNLTLSGGTANGVLYLNGSKVATSGSALTFDGTSFVAGVSAGAGQHIFRTYTSGGFAAIYNGAVTPGSTNYSFVTNATQTTLNAATFISGEVGGTEGFRLTSTGLGIGTSSPGFKLDINGVAAVRAGNAIRYYRADNAIYTQLYDAGSSGFTLDNTNGNGFRFQSAGNNQAVLDSSGNLGLGVTPSAWTGSGGKNIEIGATGNAIFGSASLTTYIYNANFDSSWKYSRSDFASRYEQQAGIHRWFTAPSGTAGNAITFTQAMTLDASGNLLVGTTSAAGYRLRVYDGISQFTQATSANDCADFWNRATTGDNKFVTFYTETSATARGSIDYNRAGGLTRYNTTSDYRAKDIIGVLGSTGDAIDAFKVYVGKMHGATQERPMLIAHEAQEIAPYAVSGSKDEVNEDGTPKYQQMDHSSLVPLLIAEVKSLRARVAALESK
jgi:hypothetical protein